MIAVSVRKISADCGLSTNKKCRLEFKYEEYVPFGIKYDTVPLFIDYVDPPQLL